MRYSATVVTPKRIAMAIVTRVRFRSTMCVPPCEAGVKPIVPKPVSRPECMSTSTTSEKERRTWTTATTGSILGEDSEDMGEEEACARIQRLLLAGDNRLKQGVSPAKVRESYERALAAARRAGLEEAIRPLVEIRLAGLDRLNEN